MAGDRVEAADQFDVYNTLIWASKRCFPSENEVVEFVDANQ